jgi:hypothetical protein
MHPGSQCLRGQILQTHMNVFIGKKLSNPSAHDSSAQDCSARNRSRTSRFLRSAGRLLYRLRQKEEANQIFRNLRRCATPKTAGFAVEKALCDMYDAGMPKDQVLAAADTLWPITQFELSPPG